MEPSASTDSLLSRTSTVPVIPASDRYNGFSSRRSSINGGANTTPYTERSYAAQDSAQSRPADAAPATEDTLQQLARSQTLLALLGKSSGNDDVRFRFYITSELSEESVIQRSPPAVKQEVLSPVSFPARPPSEPRGRQPSPTPARPSAETAFPPRTLSNLDRSVPRPVSFQESLDRSSSQKWVPRDDGSYQRYNRYDRNDSRGPSVGDSQQFPPRRRSASPVSRRLSLDAGGESLVKRPTIDRNRWKETAYVRAQKFESNDNGFKRHAFTNGDRPAMTESSWTTATKRPLSPSSARHDPPLTPYVKKHHPISPVAAEAAAARRSTFHKRPYNPDAIARRSASPATSKSWLPNSRPAPFQPSDSKGPESSTLAVTEETRDGPPPSRQERVNTLNRDLWDVRRQLTALKAREENIARELKDLRVPVPADPVAAAGTNGLTTEERLKGMELEMNCASSSLISLLL